MKYLLAALLALSPTSAFAAVSGYCDSAEKIATILNSSEIADPLRQAPIWEISNSGTRDDGAAEWTIRTQDCDLTVFLVAIPPKGVGKTTYEIDLPTLSE